MTSSWKSWICGVALGAALCTAGGCNIIGPLAAKVMGPQKVEAEYEPPKDQPLLVMVENYTNPADLQEPADELAMLITDKLNAQKVAPIVPQDKLLELRAQKGAAFDRMKIPDVGRAVGARQIVYVNLKQCNIEGFIGGGDVRCNVDALVKVVDVDTGQTKWPGVGDGKDFPVHTDYNPSENRRTEENIRDAVLDDLSQGIAQLFFKHEGEEGTIPGDE